jgi:glucosamine--fructose-6-phosphate aminotransferase (isomerizing)
MERAKEAGAPTLAITADPTSTLANTADAFLSTGGEITVSVKTRTYVQSLIALYLLALHLAEARSTQPGDLSPQWRKQITLAADATRAFLENQQNEIEALADLYKDTTNVFVMAAGPNLGTAPEASLKVTEMAKMHSVAYELENFMHGRLREIDTVNPVFLLAPKGAASDRMLDFLTVMDYVQAPSIVLTQDATEPMTQLAKHVIELPGSLDEFATPLLYITPLYLFGYHMAMRRGFDPGARRYPKIVPQNVRFGAFDKTTL